MPIMREIFWDKMILYRLLLVQENIVYDGSVLPAELSLLQCEL